jgi:hypothetical protein
MYDSKNRRRCETLDQCFLDGERVIVIPRMLWYISISLPEDTHFFRWYGWFKRPRITSITIIIITIIITKVKDVDGLLTRSSLSILIVPSKVVLGLSLQPIINLATLPLWRSVCLSIIRRLKGSHHITRLQVDMPITSYGEVSTVLSTVQLHAVEL